MSKNSRLNVTLILLFNALIISAYAAWETRHPAAWVTVVLVLVTLLSVMAAFEPEDKDL